MSGRTRIRRYLFLSAWFPMLFVVAGCSSPASSNGTTNSSSSSSILNDVISRGTLRVATINGNAPFESISPSGQLQGYDIDIAKQLGQALGVKVQFLRTDVAGRVTMAQTRKADISIGSFTRNEERSKVITFTDPINLEYVQLLAAANKSGLNSPPDFNKSSVTIAEATGSTQVPTVAAALPRAKKLQLSNLADELQAVLDGKADAGAFANTQIGILEKQYPGKLKTIPGALSANQEDGIGLPQGDFTWWWYVNEFVHDINSDGTNYTLYKKWFHAQPAPFAKPPVAATP